MKKINYKYIFLLLILILGFYLRAYHIDYPVVGYHNWKETHYLTEARNFANDGFFENGFLTPSWDYPTLDSDPSGVHTDSFPIISIVIGLMFNIFGSTLFGARLISILFSLASIIVVYFLTKELFKREDLAIVTSLILAINPLNIFFGRQVQLLSPSLFFCLLGVYFYTKWIKNPSWKNTFLFSIPLMIGILSKYSFILFVFPILFTYPFKKIKTKEYFDKTIFFAFIAVISYIWFKYSSSVSKSLSEQFEVVDFSVLFNSNFWNIMISFAKDNYTLLGVLFFSLGLVFWFFIIDFNKKSFSYKFISYYLFGSVLWFIFMSQKLQGHNYHQYPLLFLFVFFVSLFIISFSSILSNIFKLKNFKWIFVLIFVILLFNPSMSAKDRMFDTQFIGLDVAGEYIKENKLEGERVMHSSHQAYGLLWHADVKGTKGIPGTVEKMEFARTELNATWLFIYSWDLGILQDEDERAEYIRDNYEIKQLGFRVSDSKFVPVYFLMKYGGSFSEEKLNQIVNDIDILEKEYEFTGGNVVMNYINI
jgi:4-amino-4-deoxy-L-arabinose transferase-like glycosyltransferase